MSKNAPYFSVIIPTYNSVEYLKKSVQSVLSQTYQDYELLIIDNSSVDGTKEYLETITSGKVYKFHVNNNGVIAYSRNIGIENSRGKWLAFLDADDLWFKTKLETVHKNIEENQSAVLFAHNMILCNEYERIFLKNKVSMAGDIYYKLLRYGNPFITSSVVVNANIVSSIGGFNENKKYITAEDCELWMRLTQFGKFIFIAEHLGQLTEHSDSTSLSKVELHATATSAVRKNHLDAWKKKNTQKKVRARVIEAWGYSNSSSIHYKGGNYKKARNLALLSIRTYPFLLKNWSVFLLVCFRISVNSPLIRYLRRRKLLHK